MKFFTFGKVTCLAYGKTGNDADPYRQARLIYKVRQMAIGGSSDISKFPMNGVNAFIASIT